MLHYQSWAFVVSLLIYGFNSQNLAEDIRHGRISSYLVYPFGFWQHHAAKFFAFLALQAVVVSVVLAFCYGYSWVPPLTWSFFLSGLLLSGLMSFVWYNLQFIFGISGFWLDETWVLRVMFMVLTSFFSGAIIPLDLFPESLRQVLNYTIFPLLTFVPVRLFMGESVGSLWHWAAVLGLWSIGVFLLAAYLWRKGVRLYTGAGS
jgi:ABC-2 type transport system permease protein